ncbi:MAG: ABC transporter permease [Thermoleophilia bacterium]
MRRVLVLLGKDLRLLRRSPALVGGLILYPLIVALLVGMVVRYVGERPRVALVDADGLPATLTVGGQDFDVDETIAQAAGDVDLVQMDEDDAQRALERGEVLAVVVIPNGFARQLRGMVQQPMLELRLTRGGVATSIRDKVDALVYRLNLELQQTFIRSNLEQIGLLEQGGSGSFLGEDFTVIGLDGAEAKLAELERSADPEVAAEARQLAIFVRQVRVALGRTEGALRATANPITLEETGGQGRVQILSTQVQAYALALTLTFIGILLAAASIAVERDENVIGRLARGLVGRTQLVGSKLVLVALVGGLVGLVLALAFNVVVEVAGVAGGVDWPRLPLVLVGVLLAGLALGAFGAVIGTVAREARSATLVALLVALPVILLGLVPRASAPAAEWISHAFPFLHAVRFFEATLADAHPAGAVGREAAWLVGLAVVYGAVARLGVRRLLA